MSDKRNRLIAGRVRDAENSARRQSAKADLRLAVSFYAADDRDDDRDGDLELCRQAKVKQARSLKL
ncbi:MAG: hypothetical protein DI626_08970 [Micavibrio aeruginosavorus]|uniref:Uncharacterized protein n=1 Tax=Micavibrio aeruginosavorus TaxID=349221 RepID=A0A2W4ZTI2_9BACT|nr:MAG: hypothetical protein DI626_08970 [Micavibrio aeruginosavorus]